MIGCGLNRSCTRTWSSVCFTPSVAWSEDTTRCQVGIYSESTETDAKTLELVSRISDEFTEFMDRSLEDPSLGRGQEIDVSPFVRKCLEEHGRQGYEIAHNLVSSFAVMLEIKSSHFPSVSIWEDEAELEELFRSEGLETQYGSFFDQRYIDYLHRNFEDIDRVNWRKFEGLTGEYFDRQGFRVEWAGTRGRWSGCPRVAWQGIAGEFSRHHYPVQAAKAGRLEGHRKVALR